VQLNVFDVVEQQNQIAAYVQLASITMVKLVIQFAQSIQIILRVIFILHVKSPVAQHSMLL